MTKILIIGGYGNFGSYISRQLASEENLQIVIAGRNEKKCRAFALEINADYCCMDFTKDLRAVLITQKPDIVIHTSGPYQSQDYDVAKACIENGIHYIDLADAREFVDNIEQLNKPAKDANVAVICGASSVPCLSSAVIDHYISEFSQLTTLDYAIATAQQTNRGLATTESILSYTGKPFQSLTNGQMTTIYGWQNLHRETYPEFGGRWLCNCNIPDLSLFPKRYPDLKTIRFSAGAEVAISHLGLWAMSWLPRLGIVKSLSFMGPLLLKAARLFDWMGTGNSAFHMRMTGRDLTGAPHTKTFYILARDGDGPYIPCIPAILLAKRLAQGGLISAGAASSAGLITLEDYLDAMSNLKITSFEG